MTDKVTNGHGAKPNCSGGSTPCGWACIVRGKRCVDFLAGDAGALARKLVAQIQSESRAAGAIVTPVELAALKANAGFLSKATPAEIKNRASAAGLKELAEQGLDTSDEALSKLTDSIWQCLPSAYRGKVKQKGGLLQSAYNPDSGSFGKPDDSRGKQILRQYLEQNGRDAYTGEPIGLRTADLEHIVPIEKAGLDGDRPENHVLTSAAVNQWKSAKNLSEWLANDVSKRTTEELDASQAKAGKKRAAKNAAEDTMAEVDIGNIGDPDEFVDKLGKNYHTLGKLTGIRMSHRYTRGTGKVGSAKLEQDVGAPLQKAALKALGASGAKTDKVALAKVLAARNKIAALSREFKEGKLDEAKYKSQAADALKELQT